MKWFSGIGLFRHVFSDNDRVPTYEERVVVVNAENNERARQKIIADFREYGDVENGCEFLDQYEIQEMYDPPSKEVAEVASNTRITDIDSNEYIERYWNDLTPKSCDDIGRRHVWYNAGNGKSRCYNCKTNVDGELWKKE